MQQIQDLADESQEHVMTVKSVWPFDIVPDELVIDMNKIQIAHNTIMHRSVFPIRVRDITAIKVDHDPFFATLRVEISGYETNPPPLRFLPVSEALQAKRFILGLMAAQKQGIELSGLDYEQVKEKLVTIGKAHG